MNCADLVTTDDKPIATYAIQFWWQSVSSKFRHPVAFFFTKTATTEQITAWLQQGLTLLYRAGFISLAVLCDGGSANRGMMKVWRGYGAPSKRPPF